MTVWDAWNLNAPATARELAQDGEPAPGSTTEPQDATSPSAGLSGASAGQRLIAAATEALAIAKARNLTLDEAWAQRLSNLKPYATDEAIAHALRNDAGWMAWQEVKRLRAENQRIMLMIQAEGAAYALAIVTAEKANWPHAGAMHDGARTACDRIIRQLEARGE